MKILSIDAWREDENSWTWNNWFNVGDISKEEFEKLTTTRQYLKWFRKNGYLADGSQGMLTIEDDGYNIVIIARCDREPLYAIEYGPDYL